MANIAPFRFTVCGLLSDVSFHKAKCTAEDLHNQEPKLFPEPDIQGMLEFEWNLFLDNKKRELKGDTWVFEDKTIVFVNNQFIGGYKEILELAAQEYNYRDFRPDTLYEALTEECYKKHLNASKHEYVYLDVNVADKHQGRLLIELFSDAVPKTCANFKALCTGEKGESTQTEYKLHYQNSVFHRVVKNGWIQGGDIWMRRGDGGESIYGAAFEDENFAVKHNRRGILGMSNKGRHTNGSQFYITLQPASWMDTKYVAFGQVIEGTETLEAIEKVETMNERPMTDVVITDSGVCTYEF